VVTLQHFSKWAWLVLLHWKAGLVGGGAMGAVTAALLLIEHWWGQFPKRYFVYVFVFGFLFVSGFLTWEDQYNEAIFWGAVNSHLNAENTDLRSKNTALENTPPKTIVHTIPTPELEKRCWVSNHVGMPNSTIKGAVTATASILRCNYKIEAPWQVTLAFDREFIPGALTLPDSGTWFPGGGPGKLGLSYSLQINSPALLSEQLVVVTVYGNTDQFPRALRGSINSLK
jgi:hypothetical protein